MFISIHNLYFAFVLDTNKPKNYLQLGGRILLAFMFITLIRLEISFFQVSINDYTFYFTHTLKKHLMYLKIIIIKSVEQLDFVYGILKVPFPMDCHKGFNCQIKFCNFADQ